MTATIATVQGKFLTENVMVELCGEFESLYLRFRRFSSFLRSFKLLLIDVDGSLEPSTA